MGQDLLVSSDSTVDLGQHHFLRKKKFKKKCSPLTIDHYLESSRADANKKSNVRRWPFISNYLDLSFDVSRIIPKVYPSVQDFLSCFSPIIFDLSWLIRCNLYYLSVQDSVPIPSCIFILFYPCKSLVSFGPRFCRLTISYFYPELSRLIPNYLGHLSAT